MRDSSKDAGAIRLSSILRLRPPCAGKMNPLLLLGGLAGAQTFTGALAAVQEKAGSWTPVLAYTVPYATSNILLTLCGALIVALVV